MKELVLQSRKKRVKATKLEDTWDNETQALADMRRIVLNAASLPTFEIIKGPIAWLIVCLCCGRASYNHGDITERYCGYCSQFHEKEDYANHSSR